MRTRVLLSLSIVVLSLVAVGQELLTRQMNLSEITEQAGTIVRGQVVAVSIEPHPDYPNVPTIKVELKLSEAIAGAEGNQFAFRVYFPDGKLGKSGMKVARRADYRVGDEVVLFLYPSSRFGLTSTVGGDQGRFHISSDGQRQFVSNRLGNRGLFDGVEAQTQAKAIQLSTAQRKLVRQTQGDAELQSFLGVVRQLAAGKKSR